MKVKFIPLDFDYLDINEKEVIRIFGRTKEGKRCVILDSINPYFWVLPKEHADLKKFSEKIYEIDVKNYGRKARVLDVLIKDKKFMGKNIRAVQVFVENHKDIPLIVEVIKRMKETDAKKEINFSLITRYLIEKEITPLKLYSVEGRVLEKEEIENLKWNLDSDMVIEASLIKQEENEDFKPKILAFDIESAEFEIGKGEILMVSVAGEGIEKVIVTRKFDGKTKNMIFVKDERELIQEFVKTVKNYQPDILTGYFSDGFDMPYIRERAEKNRLKLGIGIDGSSISFIKGIIQSSKITGIVHIDLYKFVNTMISYILKSETLSLNEVASELIGEEKLKFDMKKTASHITKGRDIDWESFALYNLQDSAITYKLALKLWPNISELTKFIGEPLFNVSRASYSQLVENYIIHNLKEFNEIAENRPSHDRIAERRKRKKYEGAFVFQPSPGLYENIAVFDFRSLYPSIITSFNLSPSSIQEDEKNAYETPEMQEGKKKIRFYFNKKKSIIPILLQRLLDERKKIKEQKKKEKTAILEARDYNLKTLANAAYGYYAYSGARYYSPESAASATAIGRYYLHETIEKIEKKGYKVIYGDTDSIVILLENKKEKDALEMLKDINEKLPGTMELELEDFYKRGIFVTKRTGNQGAKKKYAMLSKEGKIKIRGFETVRRDWCDLAKEVQDKVLKAVLEEGNAESSLKYVKKIIKELKEKKIPVEELIIKTQLKKGILEYENIGPHVTIAKEMINRGMPVREGAIIEYVVSRGKPKERIRDKARLPEDMKEGDYDLDYYINNQIINAVGSIFEVFNIDLKELSEGKKQKKLADF